MMKIKFTALFIIAFTITYASYLYADAVTSGSTVSVNSDSSFNALRNPAHMSRSYKENTAFMYLYSYLAHYNSDAEIILGGLKADTKSSINEDYNGSLFISSLQHSGRSTYGLGISRTGDGQTAFSDSETEIQAGAFNSRSSEKKDFFGYTLMLSYSYKLNNRESVGMQVETLASYESKEKEEHNSTPEDMELQIDKTKVTSGFTFGYYLLENNFEFGALLKTGRYGFENQKYKLNKNSVNSDNEVSNYYMNDEGLGGMLGFGVKPLSKISIFLEAGYSIPYTHEERSCDDDTLNENKFEVNLQYSYGMRGGISYKYNPLINLGFGASYIGFKAYSSDKDGIKKGTTDYAVYQITTGVDIKPSNDYTLLFGLDYNRVMADLKNEDSSISYHFKLTKDYVDVMAGVSCNY